MKPVTTTPSWIRWYRRRPQPSVYRSPYNINYMGQPRLKIVSNGQQINGSISTQEEKI
jgi:hypothetical protein